MHEHPADQPCPCGSGKHYADCCLPSISGARPAGTAEALMRSRYSAFALGDVDYLLTSWHSSTRPQQLELDTAQQWVRLKIINTSKDSVEFIATCKLNGKAHKLHEVSRFVFEHGRWYYLDGHTP